MKLRKLMIPLVAITLAVFSISTAAAEDEATGGETVDFLFVQYAKSVKLADGKLTMNGIQPETLYFSDRPDRVVGRLATKKFVEYLWKEGEDSFVKNPPNAVLVVMSEPVPLDLVVVLKEPVLNGDTLVYKVEVLDGPSSGEGKANALFIDVVGRPRGEVRQEARQEMRQTSRRTARRVDRREERREGDDD
jgi:hypothetical protein